MNVKSMFEILVVCLILLSVSAVGAVETGKTGGEQVKSPPAEKKAEKAGPAGQRAVEKLDETAIAVKARMEAAVKYGHEKMRKRIEWLRQKADKLQAEAKKLEARIEAQVKRERERIERNIPSGRAKPEVRKKEEPSQAPKKL